MNEEIFFLKKRVLFYSKIFVNEKELFYFYLNNYQKCRGNFQNCFFA